MKQYLYDVQVKVAWSSFTSVRSAYKIHQVLLIFTPSFTFDIFQLIAKQTITFLLIFTLSLRSTFISTYYQTNYHIPFNFYTVVYIQHIFQLSTKHKLSQCAI